MEPLPRMKILNDIERTIHRLLAITGMDVLKYRSFKKVFRFQFNIVQATLFCICDAYSFYQFRNEQFKLIFSLCIVGIVMQGVSTMFIFVIRNSDMRQRFLEVRAFHESVAADPGEEEIKNWYCTTMRRLCQIYMFAYSSLIILNLMYSLIGRIFFGQRTLLFGLDVPFLDETVSPDYEIVLGYQMIQDLYTWANIVSFQYFYIVMVLHNCCLMDIIKQKLKAPWEMRSANNWIRLREILASHQRQLEYFEGLTSILNPYHTTQLFSTAATSTLLAFFLLFDVWIPGYVLLVLSLGMLFVNCIYGTYTEKKGDQLVEAFFHSLDWTVITPRERRIVVILLKSAQNNTHLRCGKIFVVNYHTFLNVSGGNGKAK